MQEIKHKVTVYILVYNNIDGLQRTVDSVMNQDYGDIEIIISDDGSTRYDTDCLQDYAKVLKTKYENVIVNINEQNVGTVKHINKVYDIASGEYLIPLSSGDVFKDKKIVSDIVKLFEKRKCLIITSNHLDEYDNGKKKVRPGNKIFWLARLFPKTFLGLMIRKKNYYSGCSTFYNRKLFEKYGQFDEKYHLVEDYPYYVMLLMNKEKFTFLNRISVIHEMGGVSTGKVHPSIYKDIENLRERLYEKRDCFDKKTNQFLVKCHEKFGKE